MNSIATKTGDDGSTSLLFGRRVSKTDMRIVANGRVDELNVRRLESEGFTYKGWATPGGNLPAASLDCARTACRNAELGLLIVRDAGLLNPQRSDLMLHSLNRLSDVLWLEARRAESTIPAPQA